MAKDKKTIVIYSDWESVFDQLDDVEAGKLIKHFFAYVNDKNPELEDRLLKIAFEPIKMQLKRDLKKWESVKEEKSNGGKLGNLKRWNIDLYEKVVKKELTLKEAETISLNRIPSHTDKNNRIPSHTVAKIAVNVNDNVSVNDNVNVISTNVEIVDNDFDEKKIDSEIQEAFLESQKGKEKKVAQKKENNFDFADSLKYESHSWLESVSMQQKIPTEEVVKKIDDFLIFLKTQEKNHENRKEFISHFVNWISKHKKIEENGKQPEKPVIGRMSAETLAENLKGWE